MASTKYAETGLEHGRLHGQDTELEQLDDVERQLAQLQARRASLQSRVNARLDPLSSKLPIEITSYIFQLFIWAHQELEWPGPKAAGMSFRPVPPHIPLRLGAVCKRWRDMAWDTPDLWTTLIISLACGKHTMDPEIVAQWLRRTGSRPLVIKVGIREHPEKAHQCDACIHAHGTAIMQSINRHAAQWRCLDLSGLPDEILRELDDSQYTDVSTPSLLEYLSIGDKLDTPDLAPDMAPVLHKSKRKHCPTHLTLVATFPAFMINISWTRMTSIHMQSVYPAFCFGIIKEAAASLQELSLSEIYGDDEENWVSQERVTLPSLISFTIMEQNTETRTMSTLLDSLVLPALKSLCFRREVWHLPGGYIPVAYIMSLVQRSRCNLQNLTLINPMVVAESLMTLLKAVPTVQDLTLVFERVAKQCILLLLKQLSRRHDTHQLLPNLKIFNITSPPLPSWTPLFNIFENSTQSRDAPATVRSSRERLKVVFRVHPDTPVGNKQTRLYLLDPESLKILLSLWHDKGIYCYIRHSFDTRSPADLLLQSYLLHFKIRSSCSVYDRLVTMPYFDRQDGGSENIM